MSRQAVRRCGLIAVFLACGFAVSAQGIDVVIFKDGFKIQGRKFKETEKISDDKNQVTVVIPAARGFDIIEDGPKWIIFSSNTKQTASIENIPSPPETKDYKRETYLRTQYPLPAYGEITAGDFDKNWKRMIKVKTGGGNFHDIEQRIYSISPSRVVMVSTTHKWLQLHSTKELTPQLVRNILSTHPDLVELAGKPDVGKRLDIAGFFKEVGWLDTAREELDRLKDAVPGPWAKDLTERYEQLRADIPKAENKLYIDELAAALTAGRYDAARGLIARFDPKVADAIETKRFADLKAQVEIVRPRYEQVVKLLRDALDELGGAKAVLPQLAAAGGAVRPFAPGGAGDARIAALVEAGEQVFAELHPDMTGRVELFLNLAAQADQLRKAGKSPGVGPDQLVALAVTGWLKGKNGAEPNLDVAIRLWQARQMLLDYQNEDQMNGRRTIANRFLRSVNGKGVPFDELAQLISLLPPPKPEDPANPFGTKIEPGEKVLPGLVMKNTGPLPEAAAGVNYVLRLPPEYHHGRPYPVLLACTHLGVPAEQMASLLATEADRHGYIVAAPVWNDDNKPHDWSGANHYKATAVLRSLLRHYRVDNDRVFLFGFGDGANYAMDVGASHPDLFAGLVAMGPIPKYFGYFMHYWRNLQKLPVYVVTGNINGASLENLRRVYEHWMPKGFPAMMSVYRGRGLEWYSAEVPAIFQWMSPNPRDPDRPKRRVAGTESLRLGQFAVEPWYTMRTGDNRFYWVGADGIVDRCLLENNKAGNFLPAELYADIRSGNQIDIRSRGIKQITIWLDRDMIDWSKKVFVRHNGNVPKGFKAEVKKPDLDVMLEQLYQHGDRRMLFLNKIELEVVP